MYEFYNAHPKGLRVNDCVKRAIAKATGIDYMEVSRELNRYKKVTGAKSFNSDRNCFKYVENVLKAKKLSFPAVKGKARMNGRRFCEEFSKGSYILNMAGHWSCCVDGVIYDTWDCSEKCVYTAYQIIDEKQQEEEMLSELNSLAEEYEKQLAKLKKQYDSKVKKVCEKYNKNQPKGYVIYDKQEDEYRGSCNTISNEKNGVIDYCYHNINTAHKIAERFNLYADSKNRFIVVEV